MPAGVVWRWPEEWCQGCWWIVAEQVWEDKASCGAVWLGSCRHRCRSLLVIEIVYVPQVGSSQRWWIRWLKSTLESYWAAINLTVVLFMQRILNQYQLQNSRICWFRYRTSCRWVPDNALKKRGCSCIQAYQRPALFMLFPAGYIFDRRECIVRRFTK